MLSNWIKYYNVLLTWSALYTSLVSLEVLLLSKAHWIVSSDQRSIKMSVASLLHNLPRFFDAISSTRFWRFDPRAFAFVVSQSAKTLGTKIPTVSVSQWFGYPRVLGTPVPKSLVFWVSPVGIPKTLKALNTADWGKWNHQTFCSKTIYFLTKLCLNRLKLS